MKEPNFLKDYLQHKIPLNAALKVIFYSVILISGLAWGIYGVYEYFWNQRLKDPKYNIVAIIQTGPEKESLKTSFLAELLGFSIERPHNLYRFDLHKGLEKLKAFPLIEDAQLKRVPPGMLFIDYSIRKPVALISDYSNTAIDCNRYLIPFKPFFSPKKLPLIACGWQNIQKQWGDQLNESRIFLAFMVLNTLHNICSDSIPIKIDVSQVEHSSLGSQRVVVILEEPHKDQMVQITLILNNSYIEDGIRRYAMIKKRSSKYLQQSTLIDLRLLKLAYMELNKEKL